MPQPTYSFVPPVAVPQERGDWPARLGALVLVCAAHVALLTWLVFAPSAPPAHLSPSAVIGELVTEAPVPVSTRPLAPPETRPEPQPKPSPRPAVRPAPAPHPEPRHELRREPRSEQPARPAPTPALPAPEAPPSDRAPSVPAQATPPSEAPQRPAAAASPAPATTPADHSEAAPVTPPRSDASALNNPAPPYPRLARSLGQEGRVLLDVYILADGSVGQVRLHHSSGYPLLDQAAITAVRGWHYIPAKRGGVPIPYWYLQPIDFELQ